MISAVASDGREQKKSDSAHDETSQDLFVARARQIDDPRMRCDAGAHLALVSALNPSPQQDQEKSKKQKTGCHDIGEDAHVGIAVMGKEIDGKQQQERKKTSERHNSTGQAQPVSE